LRDHGAWQASGEIIVSEDMLIGLDQAPAALLRLVNGANTGKQFLRIAE
jgi:NADPH-dependent curcumin reductase